MSIFGIPTARILSPITADLSSVSFLVVDHPTWLMLDSNTVFRARILDGVVASKT
jgi:hypothetical protein